MNLKYNINQNVSYLKDISSKLVSLEQGKPFILFCIILKASFITVSCNFIILIIISNIEIFNENEQTQPSPDRKQSVVQINKGRKSKSSISDHDIFFDCKDTRSQEKDEKSLSLEDENEDYINGFKNYSLKEYGKPTDTNKSSHKVESSIRLNPCQPINSDSRKASYDT